MAHNDFLQVEDYPSKKTASKGIIRGALIAVVFGITFYFSTLYLIQNNGLYFLLLLTFSPVMIFLLSFILFIVKKKLWKQSEKCDKMLNKIYIAILFFSTLITLDMFFQGWRWYY